MKTGQPAASFELTWVASLLLFFSLTAHAGSDLTLNSPHFGGDWVTTQSSALFSGQGPAFADQLTPKWVTCTNYTTGQSVIASGWDTWSCLVPLALGDNSLFFDATTNLGDLSYTSLDVTRISGPCFSVFVSLLPSAGAGSATNTTPPNCDYSYKPGQAISLFATPSTGYEFVGWGGSGGDFSDAHSRLTTFWISGNANLNATFAVNPSACLGLTTAVNPTGTGSITVNTAQNCSGGYAPGTVISLAANVPAGYSFSGWLGSGGSFSSTTANPTTLTITGNASITASFTAVPSPSALSVSVSASPNPTTPGTPVFFKTNVLGGTGTYAHYSWTFGDGQAMAGPYLNIWHTYSSAGTYSTQCTVTDSAGATASGSTLVSITSGSVTPVTVTTLAGSGAQGSVDGTGTGATFAGPIKVAMDSAGNVYVADLGNNKIREITPVGVVTTLAGSGLQGSSDGTGAAATFHFPGDVAVDSAGNVYVADTYSNKIRRITAGVVTTLAGSGAPGSADGTGTAATFSTPYGVATDSSDNIYVADTYSHKIRKITPGGVVTTLAGSGVQGSADGTGTAATFDYPYGLVTDSSDNTYVADTYSHKIRKITPAGVVTTLAGSGAPGSADGTGTSATFNFPNGVAADSSGNIYVADTSSNKIRKITPGGVVTTLAGSGVQGSADGAGATASFNEPSGVGVDSSGNVYVADYVNNKIRKITQGTPPPCYTISTLVSPPGVGSVTVNTGQNCAGGYTQGTGISLTANVPLGYTFSGWSGSGGNFSSTTANPMTFTITGNANVTASFTAIPPPSALSVSVSASPNPATTGAAVGFAAYASGGTGSYTNYSWNFGDGSVIVSVPFASAAHTYTAVGTYYPSCTVTDSSGATASGSTFVIVTSVSLAPDFRITYPSGVDAILGSDGSFLVVAGQQNTFRAVSAANPSQTLSVAYPYWTWGDGTTSSVNPVTKTWYTGGTYPVSLTIPGQPTVYHNVNVVGGIPTASYSFSYSVNGQPGGPVNPNNVSVGTGILFTSTGPPGAEYDWNFGDGTPVAPGPSVISHVFTAPGAYTVVLTVKLGGNTFQTQLPTTFFVAEPPRWIVSGLAYTSGLVPGSFYVSDVVIQNPSATDWAAYSVALLDGSNPPNWKTVSVLQPLESRRMSNILKSVFGKPSGGPTYAMVVRGDTVPTNADPAIWAFTYNNNGGDPTKGTYGVAIPGVPVSMAVGPGSSAASREIPGLRDIPQTNPPGTSAAYTNIGFVNAGSIPATVNLSFFTRDGGGLSAVGNPLSLVVGPNQTTQMTQALRQALAGTGQSYDTYTASDYFMSFNVVGDGAKVVPYASVKDVASTDSIFLTSAPTASGPFRIPSIVRTNTATGDMFRSRVVVFNPSSEDRTVKLAYSYLRCPAGQACESRTQLGATLPLASGGTILADDFVQAWFASFGFTISDTDSYIQSYLDVAPADANTDPLLVRGETYNAQPNGNFGTQVPGLLPAVNGASPGSARTRLTIPYVVPLSGQSGYRTNVALVTLGDAPAQATIILHAPFLNSGFPGDLSQTSVTVNDKFLQLRLEQLFPQLSNFPVNPGGYYSLEIQVTSGTLAAYAVINDNVTSDGSLILAQPLP